MSELTEISGAKEFLVDRIVEEAAKEGIDLSETERRMLYFTESGWMPFDFAEVNNAFEASYDTSTYETKISNLVRNLIARMRRENPSQLELWVQARRKLSQEDHYLLVLIGLAEGKFSVPQAGQSSDWTYFVRVIFFVVLIGLVLSAAFAAYAHLHP